MSGGGGGNDTWRKPARPVGTGALGDDDSCAISEITTINSPDRAVLSALPVGTVLDLVLDMGPPRRLLARTATGQIAGSITSPSLVQIIRCIQQGVSYGLEVLTLRGAVCQVRLVRL